MDKNFFLNPQDLLQKKYEALRASYLEDLTDKAELEITQDEIVVTYKKNTYNPMIKDWVTKFPPINVSWWNNRKLNFKFA